jgi:hypothetical protein
MVVCSISNRNQCTHSIDKGPLTIHMCIVFAVASNRSFYGHAACQTPKCLMQCANCGLLMLLSVSQAHARTASKKLKVMLKCLFLLVLGACFALNIILSFAHTVSAC